eukprot:11415542-Alexandrium_andersonii.AAC.1
MAETIREDIERLEGVRQQSSAKGPAKQYQAAIDFEEVCRPKADAADREVQRLQKAIDQAKEVAA